MPVEFRCIECGKLLRTAEETVGRPAECPACGAVMTVPGAAERLSQGRDWAGGEDPFAGAATFAGDDGPVNPYEAPAEYAVSPYSYSKAPPAERVRLPAMFLIIASSLGLFLQILGLAFYAVLMIAALQEGGNANEVFFGLGFQVGSGVVSLVLRTVVLLGAIKMKRLQSYGLALTAAIIAVIPCFSPCCLLELPFGIWALVVLADEDVKAAFH